MDEEERQRNREAQENERLVMESIFEKDFTAVNQAATLDAEHIVRDNFPSFRLSGHFVASPDSTAEPRQVCFVSSADDDLETVQQCHVRHLPPFRVRFVMPDTYPSMDPPEFQLDCWWLTRTQLSRLKEKLIAIWEDERDACLYTWMDFLQHECLDYLGVTWPMNISLDELSREATTTSETDESSSGEREEDDTAKKETGEIAKNVKDRTGQSRIDRFRKRLERYDRRRVKMEFRRGHYDCGICMDSHPGTRCVRLESCGHIYCLDCLGGYFGMLVDEGSLKQIACPDPSCKFRAAGNIANSSEKLLKDHEMKRIVGEEKFRRYQRLVHKQDIEGSPLACWCPRPSCQEMFIHQGSPDDKLAQCPKCSFPFCRTCRSSWHGYASFCKIKNVHAIATEYLNALKNSDAIRRRMEFKYGKKNLDKLVLTYQDEESIRTWVSQNTQTCPNCSTPIERSAGCSHMTCRVCDTHFCYLCGTVLPKDNPYQHYNNVKSSCNQQLFAGVEPQGEVVDENMDDDVFGELGLDALFELIFVGEEHDA